MPALYMAPPKPYRGCYAVLQIEGAAVVVRLVFAESAAGNIQHACFHMDRAAVIRVCAVSVCIHARYVIVEGAALNVQRAGFDIDCAAVFFLDEIVVEFAVLDGDRSAVHIDRAAAVIGAVIGNNAVVHNERSAVDADGAAHNCIAFCDCAAVHDKRGLVVDVNRSAREK